MRDEEEIRRTAQNFTDGAIFSPTVARMLVQLGEACPGVAEWSLMLAVLRVWDGLPSSQKVDSIAEAAIIDRGALDLTEPPRDGADEGEKATPRGSLEFWPALDDACLLPVDEAGDGHYVIRTDEIDGVGKWIATVIPNPALDTFSRERVARLMARSAELWQLLREATDIGAHEAGVEGRRGRAIKLLAESAGFVPRYSEDRGATDPADDARRGVNDETLYCLPAGEPATGKETTNV